MENGDYEETRTDLHPAVYVDIIPGPPSGNKSDNSSKRPDDNENQAVIYVVPEYTRSNVESAYTALTTHQSAEGDATYVDVIS